MMIVMCIMRNRVILAKIKKNMNKIKVKLQYCKKNSRGTGSRAGLRMAILTLQVINTFVLTPTSIGIKEAVCWASTVTATESK